MPQLFNSQPIDTVIIFAGPGGYTFNSTQISNLKIAMEIHGKTVFVLVNGKRDLQDQDIADAKKLLLEQNIAQKQCLFMIYTHGEMNRFNQLN